MHSVSLFIVTPTQRNVPIQTKNQYPLAIIYIIMNAIVDFLNEGAIHRIRSSHRRAAKSYHAFLKAHITVRYIIPNYVLLRMCCARISM